MKLTILGCGTSTGVPVPGCHCAVCKSSHPRNKRTRTSALCTLDTGQNILIDTSPDLRTQALVNNIERVDAVLFTHSHADHIMGMDDVRPFNFINRNSIPCYGTTETLTNIRRVFNYIFEPDPNYEGGLLPQLSLSEISGRDPFKVLGITVQPFPLWHGKIPVTGFRFSDLGYATDCNQLTSEAKQTLSGIRYLILDGLRHEAHKTHFTIAQAVDVAQEIGAEQTWLVHMTHSIDYDETNRNLPSNIQLAWDGMVVEFS